MRYVVGAIVLILAMMVLAPAIMTLAKKLKDYYALQFKVEEPEEREEDDESKG